jgi:L-lactate dehydrogenase complex protein LldG
MSEARTDILTAIRSSGHAGGFAAAIAAEAGALLADPSVCRPMLPTGALADIFIARVTSPKVAASAERIDGLADVPAAVARYLTAQNLAHDIALQPDAALRSADWRSFSTHKSISADETAAVGRALWGIAETGSLVFHSGPTCPTLFAFLPLHHIVVVEAANILPYLEDYSIVAAGLPIPRNVNFITGPSGTTDIEGTLVRGAHGPACLHVIVVGSEVGN